MSENRMEKINRFTRKELTEDDVYCFSVILCDNEIDRDCEKFSVEALKELAESLITTPRARIRPRGFSTPKSSPTRPERPPTARNIPVSRRRHIW